MSIFLNFTIYNDSPEPWAIGFQDGVSPGFTGIVELHDNIFFYLVVIAILVFWMLGSTIYYFNYDKTKIVHKYLVHGTLIEILWTIFPAIVLLAIAIPSFRLLYILDEVTLPTITVKVTGHQWYWSYEYSDYETESGDPIEFDSYMIPDSDLEIGQSRLLEVDNPIVLPENTHVRFIVTSTDVLHDFAIPSAGIKIDATPGRLNQSSFFSEREGELFGQCSELCGTYHGFMPIQVEVSSVEDYLSWISSLIIYFFISNNRLLKSNNQNFLRTNPNGDSTGLNRLNNLNQKKWRDSCSARDYGNSFLVYLSIFILLSLVSYPIFCYLGFYYKWVTFINYIFIAIFNFYIFSSKHLSSNTFFRWVQITIFNLMIIFFFAFILITIGIDSDLFSQYRIECSTFDGNTNIGNNNTISDSANSNSSEQKYYNMRVSEETTNKAIESAGMVGKAIAENVGPNLGAAAAGGSAAGTAFKATQGVPMLQRLAIVGGVAFVTTLSTKSALNVGAAQTNNLNILNSIKSSPHSNTHPDRIPSPGPDAFINSPLEGWELECSPLETILSSILSLNISVLLLIIILLYLIFYRYILSSNKDLIWRAINYFLLKFNCKEETIERTKYFLNKGDKFNTAFIFILFIILSLLLLIILVFSIYILIELQGNIDNYVDVYNYLYDKCPTDTINK